MARAISTFIDAHHRLPRHSVTLYTHTLPTGFTSAGRHPPCLPAFSSHHRPSALPLRIPPTMRRATPNLLVDHRTLLSGGGLRLRITYLTPATDSTPDTTAAATAPRMHHRARTPTAPVHWVHCHTWINSLGGGQARRWAGGLLDGRMEGRGHFATTAWFLQSVPYYPAAWDMLCPVAPGHAQPIPALLPPAFLPFLFFHLDICLILTAQRHCPFVP